MKSIFLVGLGVILGAYLLVHSLNGKSASEKVQSLNEMNEYETKAVATATVVKNKAEKVAKVLSEDDGTAPSKPSK